ncbi:GNAT family N-acetyltransferase [bacterium]|nr:MAG: GNAT family N-acetyltransferase [bacterium]
MPADIIRASRSQNNIRLFEELQSCGLIDYSSGGYARWRWQYLENPLSSGEPAEWIYKVEGKNAGHLGAIPVRLKAGGRELNAGWAVDLATLPEYRKKGIGMALVEEASKNFDIFLAVGQTDMSFNMFKKAGWSFLGSLDYYLRVSDAGVLLNPFFAAFNFFNRPKPGRDMSVRRIDAFDENADILWKEIVAGYKAIVRRDSVYLNWRYCRQPDIEYVKFCAERGGMVRGYIILRCLKKGGLKPEGIIVDIIALPQERFVIETLLSAALEYFKKEGCALVRCHFSGAGFNSILRRCGFIARKPFLRFSISARRGVHVEENLEDWFLSAGDSDINR